MKLAVVVQRYGSSINGGAELHARYVAERLARHAEVEVLTTCATDYVTWRNELPAGVEPINGVAVRRFEVSGPRDPVVFGAKSAQVFDKTHSVADELAWLEAEGPTSPGLVSYIAKHATDYDYWIFFSFRYYHAYHGVRAAAGRAILVPTAERDPSVGLSIFGPIFRGVRALMYNSPEERRMIRAVSGNENVPSVVVGVGSDVPANTQPGRFRQKHNLRGPFAIYVGRIDENKGCAELFDYFQRYVSEGAGQLSLVLVGKSILPVPDHPRIRHVGFLSDEDKFDALAAADLLIMPSYFESLSMVALEAWALGKPVIVNGRCDVLKGQAMRSNAGLYYESREEFIETLLAVERNRWLAATLGRNGRRFYREHYDWPVIERKYLDMLQRLSSEPAPVLTPLPGWFDQRKPNCPAAAGVVAALPAGPDIRVERGDTVVTREPVDRWEPVDRREAVERPEPSPRRESAAAAAPDRPRPPRGRDGGTAAAHQGRGRRRGRPSSRGGSA